MTALGSEAVQSLLALAASAVIEGTGFINSGRYRTASVMGMVRNHLGELFEIEVVIGPVDLPAPTALIGHAEAGP